MKTLHDWPAPPTDDHLFVVFFSIFPDVTPRWDLEDQTVLLPYETMADVVEGRVR